MNDVLDFARRNFSRVLLGCMGVWAALLVTIALFGPHGPFPAWFFTLASWTSLWLVAVSLGYVFSPRQRAG